MTAVLQAVVVVEAVALVLLGVLVVGLLRSHGDVLRTLHQLGAGRDQPGGPAVSFAPAPGDGRPAPPVSGVTLADEAVSWPVAAGPDTLLAFLSGGCETCLPFWSALREPVAVPGGADLLVVAGGPERESETLLRRLAPPGVPLVLSSQAWEDYEVPGSPHFVYVDGATGRVAGEGSAASWPQVAELLERAVGDRRPGRSRVDLELVRAGVAAGDPRLYADPDPAVRAADGGR